MPHAGTPRPAPVFQAPFDLTPIECLPALLDRGAFRFWNERPWASVTPVGGARVTLTSWRGCRHAQPAVGRAQGSCRKPGSIHTNPTPRRLPHTCRLLTADRQLSGLGCGDARTVTRKERLAGRKRPSRTLYSRGWRVSTHCACPRLHADSKTHSAAGPHPTPKACGAHQGDGWPRRAKG